MYSYGLFCGPESHIKKYYLEGGEGGIDEGKTILLNFFVIGRFLTSI